MFCKWVIFKLMFRKCLAHSESSEMETMEQDTADLALLIEQSNKKW